MLVKGQCKERREGTRNSFNLQKKKTNREMEVGGYPLSTLLCSLAALKEEQLKLEAPAGLHQINSPGAFEI